jgi:hypothetical protein
MGRACRNLSAITPFLVWVCFCCLFQPRASRGSDRSINKDRAMRTIAEGQKALLIFGAAEKMELRIVAGVTILQQDVAAPPYCGGCNRPYSFG